MSRLRPILFRLRALFRKEKLDADMAEEMRLHLELRAQRNMGAGMSAEDARFAAQKNFGGVEQLKETARDQRNWRWVEHAFQDLRYGFRTLRKDWGFAATAVLTLALGIGGTTAFFTALNVVAFKPLPVPAPGELVLVSRSDATMTTPVNGDYFLFSFPLYEELRSATPDLGGLAAIGQGLPFPNAVLQPQGVPERVFAYQVTGNYFPLLGVQPALGRLLGPDDDRPENPQPVVVLSHLFWTRRFGSDPGVIGRTIVLDGHPCTIVGVAGASFTGIEVGFVQDLWMPLQLIRQFDPVSGPQRLNNRTTPMLKLFGRIAPGGPRERAGAAFDVVFRRYLRTAAADSGAQWATSPQRRYFDGRLAVIPGAEGFNQALPFLMPSIRILAVIVALVLLLALANVASLMAARATLRHREFALRGALGAGGGRLIRQVLTETLLLSSAGGATGLLLARWGLDLLVGEAVSAGPLTILKAAVRLNPDVRIFAFVTTISIIVGVLVGLLPALRFRRLDLVTALKAQGHGASGYARPGLGQILVVMQLAISVCLLAGSGLLIRTAQNLKHVDLGFNRENLSQFRVDLERRTDANRRAAIAQEMLVRLNALPGVGAASVSRGAWGSNAKMKFEADGYTASPGEAISAHQTYAGPGFFETWQIPLVQGRGFRAEEVFPADARTAENVPGVAVVSESLALAYFGTRDPIGRELRFAAQAPVSIVGVARDVAFEGVRQKSPYVIYLPLARSLARETQLLFQIRTVRDAPNLLDLRSLASGVGSDLSVPFGPQLVEAQVDSQTGHERAIARLASVVSVFALILACIGLYGALAFNVGRRTREIGIRMALGAQAAGIARLVLSQGLSLALAGCAVGLAGAVALMRLARSSLFGVTPADPFTLIATSGVMVGVALLASWLPARRATKVDPIIALRAE